MKRREFVIKSSLATAAIGTTSFMESGMAYSKNTTDSINFGVIGTGDRGGGLINIMNNIPELNVISCCDILPFRLQKGIANTSGKAKGYSDYRKLLEQMNQIEAGHPGLKLAGNYRTGISLSYCIESAAL